MQCARNATLKPWDLKPWDDIQVTQRGDGLWTRPLLPVDLAGILPRTLPGWYWPAVAVFLGGLLWTFPTAQGLGIALGLGLVMGGALALTGWRKWLAIGCGLAVLFLPLIGPAHAGEAGIASVYSDKYHGRKGAAGVVFDQGKLTAAHKTLPFGTMVQVTSNKTGKSVVVMITDRGPFVAGRVIDLTRAAAKAIDMPFGLQAVVLEIVGKEAVPKG